MSSRVRHGHRGAIALAMLAAAGAGCGITARVAVGPTITMDGQLGVEVRVTQGGVSEAGSSSLSMSGVLAAGAGISAEDHGFGGLVALGNDLMRLPAPGAWGGRVGYRLGLRAGDGGSFLVGGNVAVLREIGSVIKAIAALGSELQCEYLAGFGDDPYDGGLCSLGLTLELTNAQAFPRPPFHYY